MDIIVWLSLLIHSFMELYNKVEDYYAIIEEPMDFGTIRAKLHERMYKTLEQFEVKNFLF